MASVYSATLPKNAELLPDEAASSGSMVAKRLREFTHGRHCARAAMAQLGHEPVAIVKADSRAPVWPPELCGSITHSGAVAAAIVGLSETYAGLGIDIETRDTVSEDIARIVCRPDELADTDTQRIKLLFSAKEAIYKCIYPTVQRYVDFQEMGVTLDNTGRFLAQPDSEHFAPEAIAGMEGRYAVGDELIVCVAWLPR